MSTHDRHGPRRWWLLLVLFTGFSVPAAAEGPGLGKPLAVAGIETAILPDGTGLPAGRGTAVTGKPLYEAHCSACHGVDGEGATNDRLVGGHGSLDSAHPVKTIGSYWPFATTVFDYVYRAMPYTAPGSLGADDTYAITAWLLHANGIIGRDEVMDPSSLPAVEMPARSRYSTVLAP